MASTPFTWSYDLAAGDCLDAAKFNAAMSALEAYVNGLCSRLDALGSVTPPDLSVYATAAQLAAHQTAVCPHDAMVKWNGGVPIVGAPLPPGQCVKVQHLLVTVSMVPQPVVFPALLGVLGVSATVILGPAVPVSVLNVGLNLITIQAPVSTRVSVLIWGH